MRSPRRGRARAVGAATALLLASTTCLAGCTETPSVVRDPDAPAPMSVPVDQTAAPNVDLAAAKKAAGIADCPATSADSQPATGGLPDVTLECLGGGRKVRLADLRGPMLVNVWASWCGGCRNEAPFLAAAARAGSRVQLIGVDYADDPEPAVAFAGQAGWTYPQLYDQDLVLRSRLQVTALPQTFFVRADGTLAGRHAGPFTSDQQLADLSRQYLGVAP